MSDNKKTCLNSECTKESCEGSDKNPKIFLEKTHDYNSIKKVIGIVSGKGGVGKSLVTSMLAVLMNRKGYKSAVLDADVTGPSIPKIFGLKGKAQGSEMGLFPMQSKTGIGVMSVNLLLESDTDPVIWRGPLIANTVKQFWTDVIWGDVDYMFIDMPPGTGDVPLTVFQSIPVDGIIIVTSPQELVSMIVTKAVKMAEKMNIPILGLIENMSYITCPECSEKIKVFGESHIEEIASEHTVNMIAKMPIDQTVATACDNGMIELFDGNWLDEIAEMIGKTLETE